MKIRHIFIAVAFLFSFTQVKAQYTLESQVPTYTLPPLLQNSDGSQTTSSTTWNSTRRKEILSLFENNVYGQLPNDYDSIKYIVYKENKLAMSGKAHLKQVYIKVFRKGKSVTIDLTLFTPNSVTGAAPAFLFINSRKKFHVDPTLSYVSSTWPAEMVINNGFAIAGFHVSDVAEDNATTYMNKVLQLYPEQLTMNNGMRSIGAWAWAASRVMDYFEKDIKVNEKKVGVVGHSRGGKSALWAAAKDQRFAISFASCAGKGGPAVYRRKFGESIGALTGGHPHWFPPVLKTYSTYENKLPVDAHSLIALMAPRPVYLSNATEDLHADPKGSFLALKNAEKAYALFGKAPMPVSQMPAPNTPIINSHLGFHLREGAHDILRYDWNNYIAFAKNHFASTTIEETTPTTPPTSTTPTASGTGLRATYYNNMDFTGTTATRVDPTVNFDWYSSASPISGINPYSYSVRWQGEVQAKYSQTYTFYTLSDDGVRLWVNGQLLINNWTNHGDTEDRGTISLEAGKRYSIQLEYYQNSGGSTAKLYWSSSSQAKQIIPASNLYPTTSTARIASSEEVAQAKDINVQVYPVPASEEINLESNGAEVEAVRIINSIGVPVLTREAIKANQVKIELGQLAEGVYIVEVTTVEGKRITKKIIVKR